jgi:hypothetical protein
MQMDEHFQIDVPGDRVEFNANDTDQESILVSSRAMRRILT